MPVKRAGNFKNPAEDAVSTAIHSKKERMSDIIIIYNNSNSYNNNNNNNKNNILHIALMNRYNNALEGSTSMVSFDHIQCSPVQVFTFLLCRHQYIDFEIWGLGLVNSLFIK